MESEIRDNLIQLPVVAIVGPRQCGKSTLARRIIGDFENSIYLDLEKPSDLFKLDEPEIFLGSNRGKLICLDEIQRRPEIFPVLRSFVDETGTSGQFLILGSASPELLRQSSESLAGRIAYTELMPFTWNEISSMADISWERYLERGGFPRSLICTSSSASLKWRLNFIRTYIERDIFQLGFNIPSLTLHRLLLMCAHSHGQCQNLSKIGDSLGVSHTTVRKYIDILVHTYILMVLPPFEANLKKRLVKTPKIYFRDSGILLALLGIDDFSQLLGHPIFGSSWEGMAIINIIASNPGWNPSFYRDSNGTEIDLVLEKGGRLKAFECKASATPSLNCGFWTAMSELNIGEAFVVAPVSSAYPIKNNVKVIPLGEIASNY
ncbi:MAG TPA: ATP-binding protein [Lentisphaeria bacterium]|nr:MAG: hypothetical protein A2X45_18435 [Lentisphaerae bacterium GWF2_50_93]HCE45755.1 ATP-binding protein [Lentisphaeria bacterium]